MTDGRVFDCPVGAGTIACSYFFSRALKVVRLCTGSGKEAWEEETKKGFVSYVSNERPLIYGAVDGRDGVRLGYRVVEECRMYGVWSVFPAMQTRGRLGFAWLGFS